MADAVEKKIGETTYRVTPFGARKGRSVLFLLSKLLGGTLGALKDAEGGDVLAGISAALGAWALSAREEDFEAVCTALEGGSEFRMAVGADVAVWQSLATHFDQHFVGKYDEMIGWIAFALEVNFSSFFVGTLTAGFLKRATAGAVAA